MSDGPTEQNFLHVYVQKAGAVEPGSRNGEVTILVKGRNYAFKASVTGSWLCGLPEWGGEIFGGGVSEAVVMASFGLSGGASWGSEGSRPRRKRPYFSPSPPHEDDEEEEEGWGGPWGSLDRDERGRPREEEEEEEEEEGRRVRVPPWEPLGAGAQEEEPPPMEEEPPDGGRGRRRRRMPSAGGRGGWRAAPRRGPAAPAAAATGARGAPAPDTKTDQGVSLELWHRRFGHREEKAIRELQYRHLGLGLLINDADAGGNAKCAVCLRVKRPASTPLPKMQRTSAEMLDLIHGVLHGPFPELSHKHHRYALIFVDDYSRYCFTYLLKDEGEIQEVLAKYLISLDVRFQRKPKVFQMEKGAASFSQSSKTFLEERGILYRVWGQHPSEEARTAVMEMSCLLEMTQCMLEDAALPAKFWNHAFMMASYLLNILPVEGCSRTPFELWRGKVPQMKHLRVFGSLAYACVFRGKRQNLDSSTEETVLLGYGSGKKQYKVMSLETGQVLQRDVYYIVEEKTADPKGTASDPSGAQNRSVDPLLSAVASTPSRPVSHRMLEEDGTEGEPCPQREGDWW
ncbi:hypothetical protein JRQ81_008969 [Phrynocephalus forsythii]|uniref:Integrase catalytic domain-containing protein n=1 Tax=Phrynocephalus forsythii TaxID=171643 RepID=A0A9Q1ASG4_9SAUR|nr:hypothetical protein JRQ81_008969 [Phrynocephalus forsythii]